MKINVGDLIITGSLICYAIVDDWRWSIGVIVMAACMYIEGRRKA